MRLLLCGTVSIAHGLYHTAKNGRLLRKGASGPTVHGCLAGVHGALRARRDADTTHGHRLVGLPGNAWLM